MIAVLEGGVPLASLVGPVAERALGVQVALDRAGFSPGEIDAVAGGNTGRALRAFQRVSGLRPTGEIDAELTEALGPLVAEPLIAYTVTADDASGPFLAVLPEDPMELAKLPALTYTSVEERLAERFHCSPRLLRQLNPRSRFAPGDVIYVPDVEPLVVHGPDGRVRLASDRSAKAAVVIVSPRCRTIEAQDPEGQTMFHAPASIDCGLEAHPSRVARVVALHENPVFLYNPSRFPEFDPTEARTSIAPGPNSPLGLVWLETDAAHLILHGTAEPATVGHLEAPGCVRLTNWDAVRLARIVDTTTRVAVR